MERLGDRDRDRRGEREESPENRAKDPRQMQRYARLMVAETDGDSEAQVGCRLRGEKAMDPEPKTDHGHGPE